MTKIQMNLREFKISKVTNKVDMNLKMCANKM